jgi:hypothetical protein
MYTSIYQNRYANEIPGKIAAVAQETGFTGSVSQLLAASATNTAASYSTVTSITPEVIAAVQLAVKAAYVDSFQLVFRVAIAFGCLGIMAALCARSVDQKKKTDHCAITLENEKHFSTALA